MLRRRIAAVLMLAMLVTSVPTSAWGAVRVEAGVDEARTASSNGAQTDRTSGQIGDNLNYELVAYGEEHNIPYGKLVITGSGDMYEFGPDGRPWNQPKFKVVDLELPDGLTSISDSAFSNLNISSVIIPETVSHIGKAAFNNCHLLSSVQLPQRTVSLNGQTFYNCYSLNTINIPEKLTKVSSTSAEFWGCPLANVTFEGERLALPDNLFWGAAVKSMELPEELEEIGESCFASSGLVSIEIPDGVTKIGYHAFAQSHDLTRVHLPYNITELEGGTFYNCYSLKTINIPEKLTKVSSFTAEFWDCPLSTVTFEGERTVLPDNLFWGAAMETITLPETLEHIGESCFAGSKLVKIVIPDTVTYLGKQAFAQCKFLMSVSLSAGIDKLRGGTFYNCDKLESINIPEKLSEASTVHAEFKDCPLSNVDFDGVRTYLPANLFWGSAAVDMPLPKELETIGDSCFASCGELVQIKIPDNVKTVGRDAFRHCSKLALIKMPATLDKMDQLTFEVNKPTSYDYDSDGDGKADLMTTTLLMSDEPEHDYDWKKDRRYVIVKKKLPGLEDKVYDGVSINRRGTIHGKFRILDEDGFPVVNRSYKYHVVDGDDGFTEGEVNLELDKLGLKTDKDGYAEAISREYEYNSGDDSQNSRSVTFDYTYYDRTDKEWKQVPALITVNFDIKPLGYSQKWVFDDSISGSGSAGTKLGKLEIASTATHLNLGSTDSVSVENRYMDGTRKMILGENYDVKLGAKQSITPISISIPVPDVPGLSIGAGAFSGSVGIKYGQNVGAVKIFEDDDIDSAEGRYELAYTLLKARCLSKGDELGYTLLQLAEPRGAEDWNSFSAQTYFQFDAADTAFSLSAALAGASVGLFDAGAVSGSDTLSSTLTYSEGKRIKRAKTINSNSITLMSSPLLNTNYAPFVSKAEYELVDSVSDGGETMAVRAVSDYTADDLTIFGRYNESQTNTRFIFEGSDLEDACAKIGKLNEFRNDNKRYIFDQGYKEILEGIKDSDVRSKFIETGVNSRVSKFGESVSASLTGPVSVGFGKAIGNLETLEFERRSGVYENGEDNVWAEMNIAELVNEDKVDGLEDRLGLEIISLLAQMAAQLVTSETDKTAQLDDVTASSSNLYMTVAAPKETDVYRAAGYGKDGRELVLDTIGKPYLVSAFTDPEGENRVDSLGEEGTELVFDLHSYLTGVAEDEAVAGEAGAVRDLTQLERARLGIYRYSEELEGYERIDSVIDEENKTVKAVITRTGQYILAMSDESDIKLAAKQKYKLSGEDFGTDEKISKYTFDTRGIVKVSRGKLIAKKAGTVVVTANKKVNGKYEPVGHSMVVTVEAPKPVSGALNKAGDVISVEELLTGTGLTPEKWVMTSSRKYADFDAETGIVTAKKSGTVKMTAYFGSGKDAAKYTVKVRVKIPYLSSKSIKLRKGKKKILKVKNTALPAVFRSSDEAVAIVDENGKITAVGKGSAVITATVDEVDYTCTVTVR